ncbi:hypothetical protein HDZ31DRAFT_67800 [Schizophyllum fasciatum]
MTRNIHHLSLVDPALHHPAIADVLKVPVNRAVIDYIVDVTVDTVDFALGRSSALKRGRSSRRDQKRVAFTDLIARVIARAEVPITVVLVLLAYIDKCKPHLRVASDAYVHERIFLGALIVAAKYLNDCSPKNGHWARYTAEFSKADICLIEREFLAVLDFELGFREDDLLLHCDALLGCAEPSAASRHKPARHLARAQTPEIDEVPRDMSTSPVSSVSSADSTPPRTPHSEACPPAHGHVRKVAAAKPHVVLSDTPLSQICAVAVVSS